MSVQDTMCQFLDQNSAQATPVMVPLTLTAICCFWGHLKFIQEFVQEMASQRIKLSKIPIHYVAL